jgi:hypothetical protein
MGYTHEGGSWQVADVGRSEHRSPDACPALLGLRFLRRVYPDA